VLNLRDCCWLYLYLTRLTVGVGNWPRSQLLALGVGYWCLRDETSLPSFFHTNFFKNKIKSVLSKICVGNVLHTTNPKRGSSKKMDVKHLKKTQLALGDKETQCKAGSMQTR
jgi:hypothetical protein